MPHRTHYYFEKYEVRDGESEYAPMSVRRTTQPLSWNDWMREFLEFAWTANNERPWPHQRIRQFLRSPNPTLEIYHGTRIYHDFVLTEITEDEYAVLVRYLR